MLKQLRRKFIVLNMLSVTVVIVAVLGVIGFASYQQSMTSVYSSLDESINQAARLSLDQNAAPEGPADPFGPRPKDGKGPGPQGPHAQDAGQAFPIPQLGNRGRQFVPAAVYQDTDGMELTLVTQVTTASLDDTSLAIALEYTNKTHEGRGRVAPLGLLYVKRFMAGSAFIAFTDESNAAGWQELILVLIGIGAASLLVFFIISLFFSRWALKPVEEAWAQQRQFVADASHELKTPITVILANMGIMLKHPSESIASQAQWVESTQREAQGMQDLVTDLLDLARLESENAPVMHESFDLSEMTEGRLLQFESVAFESNVLSDYDIEEGVCVSGDRTQLERLTTILLDNACKYADPATTITTTLRRGAFEQGNAGAPSAMKGVAPKGTCALLTIHNTGNAVDPEDLPHLFDRFYRSDKARVRTEGSYGLGLAIAAETAISHKGCISVQSSAAEGTTFTVALPLD